MNRNYHDLGTSRKRKVISVYTRATGSNVQVFDNNFRTLGVDDKPDIEQSICMYCTCSDSCREMHIKEIQKAGRNGKAHAYQCDLGLIFWTSPIYSEGEFSGALRGSGYLVNDVDKSEFAKKCTGIISPDEFKRRVSALPACDTERVRSLAEMLLLCAESLSTGSENYHEMLRLRSEQEASLSVLIEKLRKKYPEGSMLPGYPLDKERQLIASLYRGNKRETEKILNEVLAVLVFSNSNNFRYIQMRVLEMAVLLARAGINSGSKIATEINVRYLKQIQEAKTIEELAGTLYSMVEDIIGQVTSFQGIPHALAMRKAEAYIRENFTRKISLREIAKFAGLSAPYFSTIFKEEMGENLSKYVNRLRVEKASKMLLETDSPLSEISSACCFEDQSWFTKIFKTFTGISPGKYRNQGGNIRFSA
ncbi:MAG: helix-turn-helix domain-containing protein [Treponema sp.]|nr:helix-turn-helix domain-containing protein [Treponema sp.]